MTIATDPQQTTFPSPLLPILNPLNYYHDLQDPDQDLQDLQDIKDPVEYIVQLVGEGEERLILNHDPKLIKCGEFMAISGVEGVILGRKHYCNRRECPICVDGGFCTVEANRIVDNIIKNVQKLTSRYMLTNHKGRMLKVVSGIISPPNDYPITCDKDVQDLKNIIYKQLKSAGIFWGELIYHPWRGPHDPKDSGPVIRSKLDRSKYSPHFHFIGLAYWTENTGPFYLEIKKLAYINSKTDFASLWGVVGKLAKYQLNHSGYINNKSQSITRFGKIPSMNGPIEDLQKRPKAIPQWKHPINGNIYPVGYFDDDLRGSTFHLDKNGQFQVTEYDNFDGSNNQLDKVERYKTYSYDELRVDPDDSLGILWDDWLRGYIEEKT